MTAGNEPAFPFDEELRQPERRLSEGDRVQRDGLTKREYIATKVLQGLLAGPHPPLGEDEIAITVVNSVKLAELLITALNNVPEIKR